MFKRDGAASFASGGFMEKYLKTSDLVQYILENQEEVVEMVKPKDRHSLQSTEEVLEIYILELLIQL